MRYGDFFSVLISILLFATAGDAVATGGVGLSVLSQNLHGYHPMGEAPRLVQDRDGIVRDADSDIFFFTEEELARGHARRLDEFSEQVRALSPDVVLLQEVGAGAPGLPKTCETFYANGSGESFELNSALRLQRRIGAHYRAALACRGNTGWWTESSTFQKRRVLRASPHGPELVFDFDSNPYPGGVLVEGLAILVKNTWRIVDHQQWRLDLGGGRSFFVQIAAISPVRVPAPETPWLLVANVHAGHKVAHFEQAVALRKKILEYVSSRWRSGPYLGSVIGGDFNALLYRRKDPRDPSTIPWEISVSGEFDFSGTQGAALLSAKLHAMNRDASYKEWASVTDPIEASTRIEAAVKGYFSFLEDWKKRSEAAPGLREGIEGASRAGRCQPFAVRDSGCDADERIDLLFASPDWEIENGFVPFVSNNWKSLQGISDHPGVFARWRVPHR